MRDKVNAKWIDNSILSEEKLPKACKLYSQKISLIDTIRNYLENQVKDFLKENKITEKQWRKYGCIIEKSDGLAEKTYVLCYRKSARELQREVKIEFDMVI